MRRPARPRVLNEKVKSPAGLFGGSSASWSVTPAAETVTVQVSLRAKSAVRVEREGGRAAGERGGVGAAVRARDGDRVGGDVDRLAERDRDVRWRARPGWRRRRASCRRPTARRRPAGRRTRVPPFDAPGVMAARSKSFALLSVSQPSGTRASPGRRCWRCRLVACAPSATPAIGSPAGVGERRRPARRRSRQRRRPGSPFWIRFVSGATSRSQFGVVAAFAADDEVVAAGEARRRAGRRSGRSCRWRR